MPRYQYKLQHIIACHLADAFIQSNLQLSFYPKRLAVDLTKQETYPLEQYGVKGLAHGPNSCVDLIVASPGIKPPTLQVQVK